MRIFMIAAVTADGFIGRDAEHEADWTNKEDKRTFVELTKEAGTMIFGSTTYKTIGRALPDRRMIVMTSQPDNQPAVEGVEFTNESPKNLVERLEKEGVTAVAICGGAKIYTAFMQAGLIQEVYLTVEPILFGTGVALFSSDLDQRLELINSKPLNQHTLLQHYRVMSE